MNFNEEIRNHDDKWKLIAHNNQGASVVFYGRTKREARQKFDQYYYSDGFKFTSQKLED